MKFTGVEIETGVGSNASAVGNVGGEVFEFKFSLVDRERCTNILQCFIRKTDFRIRDRCINLP